MFVAPSVLALSFDNFNEELQAVNNNAKYLHFDVMDGHFVPNLSFGPDILKQIRRNSSLFMDVHLMVSDPLYFSDIFAQAGADGITFHYEAYNDINKCIEVIDHIHSLYLKAGISINPDTKPEEIEALLPYVDLVLVMSVQPGFGGQAFKEESYDKLKYFRNLKSSRRYNYLIEVDGGVSDRNARDLVIAGADILVAGSYVFKGDIESNIKSLTMKK